MMRMRTHRILTFGLTEEQNAFVGRCIPASDYTVFDTDAPTDLIALNGTSVIIYAPAMDADSVGMLFDYYTQIGGCTDETVIWIGEPKPPKQLHTVFRVYPSFEALEGKLKYVLLNAHTKCKKAADYSEKLMYGLKILSLIRKHPGITTKSLSEETELPIRTVQRYIATLQATGEWIEYDRAARGWRLFHGISILFGDDMDGGIV